MRLICLSVFVSLVFFSCQTETSSLIYESDYLKIEEVKPGIYIHISNLKLSSGAVFECNGMVFTEDGEAVIFDTPTDIVAAAELESWLTKTKGLEVNHIIVNHFHVDCLGSLDYFHSRNIKSYAGQKTFELAEENGITLPTNSFDKLLISKIGTSEIISEFVGEAHTKDNIVSYIPSQKIMFGGCGIKSIGAGKGNVVDANTEAWPLTVAKIKAKYSEVEIVVPGHGKYGGTDLFDYTIELFKE